MSFPITSIHDALNMAEPTTINLNSVYERVKYTAWGQALVTKALTFSNDSGAVSLFTVTGDVVVQVIAICKTSVASVAGANIECGISGDTNLLIASTLSTNIDAHEIWHDNAPDVNGELLSVLKSAIISNGDDIILTLSDQVDSGAITFYCFWTPLSSDGNVVAA